MTPHDVGETLKFIQAYWPKTDWHADIVRQARAIMEKFNIDAEQAKACLTQLRCEHKYKTIQPAEIIARLKLIAYPQSHAGPTPTSTRPTMDKHEVANTRRRTPEFHDWPDWRICAHWFSGVDIKHWQSWQHWRNALAADLKFHGLDPALIPDCIADAEREHRNAIPKPQWVIQRERDKADGTWYKRALGVDVLPTTGPIAKLIAKMRAKGDDAVLAGMATRGRGEGEQG